MASPVIVPVAAHLSFDDILSQFEVCATVLIDLPIIGGTRSPKVCIKASTLGALLVKLVEIWAPIPPAGETPARRFVVGDVDPLVAALAALEALPYSALALPAAPDINAGPDDDVDEYTGDYGVTEEE